MTREYLLDSRTDLGGDQLTALAELLDGVTTTCLTAAGVRPGLRCLDVGAGAGSISRWLADHVAPEGTVLSVDLDTDRVVEAAGVEIRRHDINDGAPAGGPFDLVHVRLVLMHLKRRKEILAALVDALAPGGWLVIGEYSGGPQPVVSAPRPGDHEVFRHVQETILGVGRRGGISYEWAGELDGHLSDAGLEAIDTTRFGHTSTGGSTACALYRNYVRQVEDLVVEAGATRDEVHRFYELTLDPAFRAWFYEFTCSRGRKPA